MAARYMLNYRHDRLAHRLPGLVALLWSILALLAYVVEPASPSLALTLDPGGFRWIAPGPALMT